MIHALLQYAKDRKLISNPGYAKKNVKWVLEFNKAGSQFTGIVRVEKEFLMAPDLSQPELVALGSKKGQGSHFLVAPLGTFLGWGKDADSERKECIKRETFVWMLKEAGKMYSVLNTLSKTIVDQQTVNSMRKAVLNFKPAPKPTDWATVRVGGCFPVEQNTWHAWWEEFRASLKKQTTEQSLMTCFGTGELITPVSTHPKLKKLSGVGLSQPHAPIITFDKEAFESYGLAQSANAAMSEETAIAYVNAIDQLLESSVIYAWRRPKRNSDKKLTIDFAKLGGARLAYWYTGPAGARVEIEKKNDLIGATLGSVDKEETPPDDPEQERILAESRLRQKIDRVRSGRTVQPVGNVRFCVLALSGAGGRVMIRDFMEGTILHLAEMTERWFNDLALETYWGRQAFPPNLEQILTAPLAAKKPDQDYLKWVAPAGTWRQALWRAAITGNQLPRSAFTRAMIIHNNIIVRGDLTDEKEGPRAQRLSTFRLALIKAYLIRKGIIMNSALDPEHPSAAYHCGRLLAVYDSLQREALGEVGAGVIQRYYGGALTNPKGVFGQLSRMVQTYLSKLESWLFHVYRERIAEIHNGIRRSNETPAQYPSALDMEGQALFALGFWHQISATNKEIARASAAKKARKEFQNETFRKEEK